MQLLIRHPIKYIWNLSYIASIDTGKQQGDEERSVLSLNTNSFDTKENKVGFICKRSAANMSHGKFFQLIGKTWGTELNATV